MTLRVDVLHTQNTFRLQVAFEAPQGLTAICGHSGAGKTTLINLLAGTLTPSQGYIEINSRVLFNLEDRVNVPPERRNVGYIYQDARLFPHFSVKQNLESGRRFKKLDENPELFEHIVKLLGLESLLKRRPTKLSGGEQQRVAIGRALLSEPDFILADEPLASLDVGRRSEILPYFELLRDTMQIPILYVSHQNDEIERLATTRFEISAGQLVSPAD